MALSGCGGLTGFTGVTGTFATLSGKITDADTGSGLGGVRIVFGGNKTTTAADGTYTFRNVSVVTRQQTTVTVALSVSLDQYDTYTQDVTFTSGDSLTQDVAIAPHPDSGTVSGKVASKGDNTAITNATVTIFPVGTEETDPEFSRRAFTANDGTYQVTGLFPGDNNLKVAKSGFLTHAATLVVFSGVNPALEDIKLVPSSTSVHVAGTVKDEDGNRVSGATVTIGGKSTTSGPTGAFTVNDVTVGLQTVKVTATGFLPVEFTTEIESPPNQLTIVLFKSGVEPPGGPFNLTGKVTLSNNSDASGVTVAATENGSGVVQDTATTGAEGVYRLFVPPSNYTVRAAKSGYQTQQQAVTVPPGGQVVSNVNFTLTPTAGPSSLRHSARPAPRHATVTPFPSRRK